MKYFKKATAIILCIAIALSSMPTYVKAAQNREEVYPYTIYANAYYDEALLIESDSLCINGNLGTAGTLEAYVEYNFNHNGQAYDEVLDGNVYIYNLIDREYFSGNTEKYEESYNENNQNININKAVEVKGDVTLTGNVNLNNSLKAYRDINISGENLNANNSCIEAKYGDITIEGKNVSITGLIYAPFGNLTITAENINLNNVVVIAHSVTLKGKTVNINNNNQIAGLIGNTSEELNIPESEWQYMDDEDGDGIPDFIIDKDNWSEFKDTDKDGLPDVIEDYIGTDKTMEDTDGDSLSDYYETMLCFTDPLREDSDDNGILDPDEDYDKDGLTIREEMFIGTDPINPDTDEDNIIDGEEIHNNTNPLEKDTDNDHLDDDDEIVCGTDPLNPDTNGNGILDGDEIYYTKIEKELASDEETGAIPFVTLTMEMKGNSTKKVTIENTENIDILTTNIVGKVGAPVNLTTTEDFNTATMIFHYDRNLLGDNAEDDLAIMWYDEENLKYVELTDAVLDKENQTISYTTTHFSTYVVINKKTWYDEWRKEIDYRTIGEETKYDISFVVDVSESMRGENLERAKESLNAFIDAMHEGDKADLVQFNTSGTIIKPHGTSKEALKEAVERLEAGYDTSTNSGIEKGLEAIEPYIQADRKAIMILLCDGEVENNSKTSQLIAEANKYNVSIYTVNICNSDTSVLSYISDSTGGHTYIANTPQNIADTLNILSAETVSYIDLTDSDGDTIPDVLETNGMRIQNGQIFYSDSNSQDSDGDGIPDNEELEADLKVSNKENIISFLSLTVKLISNAMNADTDGDGYKDYIDPEDTVYTYIPFTSKTYMLDVKNTALNQYKALANERPIYSHISGNQRAKVWAQLQIKIMMKDVNECQYTYLVPDDRWFDLCTYFNKQVKLYDRIYEELHYFRLKLNRCPETLDEMIKLINNTENVNDKWIMCCPDKGRFHMFGETGAYNIKFISSNNTDNIYEAVYDKEGNLITENDDNGKNMGTYNYASSSKDPDNHTKFDVKTYKDWGNTPSDPKPVNKSWNYNVTGKEWYDNKAIQPIEPCIKGEVNTVDKDARDHYKKICEKIGIDYKKLLKNEFSDKCY